MHYNKTHCLKEAYFKPYLARETSINGERTFLNINYNSQFNKTSSCISLKKSIPFSNLIQPWDVSSLIIFSFCLTMHLIKASIVADFTVTTCDLWHNTNEYNVTTIQSYSKRQKISYTHLKQSYVVFLAICAGIYSL